MNEDDELCLCFHVTRRKVRQFIRTQQPKLASQLSECYGAGTGCGWCRPFLKRMLEAEIPSAALPVSEPKGPTSDPSVEEPIDDLSPENYAQMRRLWRESKNG
jgi:bacterioferritin-associated ferredoxin